MLKKFNDDAVPSSVKGVEFVAVNKALGISLTGTDIETLRVAVWSKLEDEFRIEWKPYLLIEIDSSGSWYRGTSEGLSLTEITVYRGMARDGTELLREYDHSRTSGPYKYRPWPGEYEDKNGRVITCIPASEENKESMKNFRARIAELRKRLADLVKPDVIMATLANFSGSNLLPAPSEATLKSIENED